MVNDLINCAHIMNCPLKLKWTGFGLVSTWRFGESGVKREQGSSVLCPHSLPYVSLHRVVAEFQSRTLNSWEEILSWGHPRDVGHLTGPPQPQTLEILLAATVQTSNKGAQRKSSTRKVCMSLTIFLAKGQENKDNKLKFQGEKKKTLATKHNRKLPIWF